MRMFLRNMDARDPTPPWCGDARGVRSCCNSSTSLVMAHRYSRRSDSSSSGKINGEQPQPLKEEESAYVFVYHKVRAAVDCCWTVGRARLVNAAGMRCSLTKLPLSFIHSCCFSMVLSYTFYFFELLFVLFLCLTYLFPFIIYVFCT